jgi:hypothetical protein
MSIKMADLSYVRRSPAEISVLRELISLRQSRRNEPTEGYLALKCQMREEQVRKVLAKLAKSCLISYRAREQDTRGYKETVYVFVLHYDHIRQLIDEGERFVHKTLHDRYENSQRGKETTPLGKSTTEREGVAQAVITKGPEASAPNQKAEDATVAKGNTAKT